MAIHTQLNIYRTAYELLLVSVDYVGQMPRQYKPAFGKSLSELAVAMILQIRAANIAQNKAPHLDVLLERLSEFETLLRIFVDKRWISKNDYAKAVELTQSVGKQANGWKGKPRATPPVT